MNTSDPLQLPPQWTYTSGAGYHDASGRVTRQTLQDPASFEHGYEQGAYALANRLFALFDRDEEGAKEAVRLLATYHRGNAHPVLGWQHEPKRS